MISALVLNLAARIVNKQGTIYPKSNAKIPAKMSKLIMIKSLFSFLSLMLLSINLLADPLRIFSTEFAPYSYIENEKLAGLSANVVFETLKNANIEYSDIEVYPWSRSYKLVQVKKNSLIFSIARTEQRENMFLWAGKIAPYKVNLYRLRSRDDIEVTSLESAKAYLSVGEYNDVKWQYLINQGFEENNHIFTAANPKIALNMLVAGRADLMPFSAFAVTQMLKENNYPEDLLVPVLTLEDISYELYAAFNLESDETLVAAFKESLEALHQSGWIANRFDEFEAEHLVE